MNFVRFVRYGARLYFGCNGNPENLRSLVGCLDLQTDKLVFRLSLNDMVMTDFAVSDNRIWVLDFGQRLLEFDLCGHPLSARAINYAEDWGNQFTLDDHGCKRPSLLLDLYSPTCMAAVPGRIVMAGGGTADNVLLEYRKGAEGYSTLPSLRAVLPGLHTATGVCAAVAALPKGQVAIAAKHEVLIGTPPSK